MHTDLRWVPLEPTTFSSEWTITHSHARK